MIVVMRVRARIQVNGRPLRRAYVEHILMGVGTTMYMTDLDGRIRDGNFDEGIDSLTPNADIRVICQNPVARVLDGDQLMIGVYQDVSIGDGDTVNLNTTAEQRDHYSILNRIHVAYETCFRPLRFFAGLPDPDFPLGRRATLRATRDQARRIDVVYPDHSVAVLAWVEPKRLGDDYPLLHLKRRDEDTRLFGDGSSAPTLIPHELTHALHFATLPVRLRERAQNEYAEFILTSPLTGLGPFHTFGELTTPEVAYIEAGGFYGQFFGEFLRTRQSGDTTLLAPTQVTTALQAEFVRAEWNRLTVSTLRGALTDRIPRWVPLPGGPRSTPPSGFPIRLDRRFVRASVTGGAVEGAVYAAIFVDFAATVGLDLAASSYFAADAITFGEYRTYINTRYPEHAQTLETVRRFWGL